MASAPQHALSGEPKVGRGPGQAKETPAVEDLMREHGVIRRSVLVYARLASLVRQDPRQVDLKLMNRTARLFRDFAEDYHERQLEEAYIFPVVRSAGGEAASYVDVLAAQHRRGREITDYILGLSRSDAIGTAQAEPLARALEAFGLMFEHHAAREDTIVFPAWKLALSQRRIDELGDRFEDIERRQLGRDGYERAVRQIAAIERACGIADIAQFTEPPPPT